MQLSTLAKRGSLVLLLAIIAFYFYGLGHLPLLGPDEPRYAQIAREMFLRGDLVTPTLGGYPWFEKPALLYWMMIASYKLFGVSEWAARLPAALAGLLTVGAVFFLSRSIERRFPQNKQVPAQHKVTGTKSFSTGLGFWSALAAATTLGIVVFSRAASFDIIVTMTMTWALSFFFVSELEQKQKIRRRLLAGFYMFVGLSLLAKGLIGIVLPLGIITAYYIFRRTWPERTASLSWFWGMPLTLMVAGLWYAPVMWRHGWPFVDQFFLQHQFARYISDKYRHPAPVYFYLLVLIPLSLPWTAFVIEGIVKAKPWQRRAHDQPMNKLLVFGFAWFLAPLLFFSFSNSKLPGYILPVLPAMALIAGERLNRLSAGAADRNWAIRLTGAVSLMMAVATPLYAARSGQPSMQVSLTIGLLLGIAGSFAIFSVRYGAASVLLIAGATLAVALVALHSWAPQALRGETSKQLLELADQRGYSKTAIYGLQRDDRSPEFYAGDRVVYGPDHEPILYEGTGPVSAESQVRKQALLVFVPLKDLGYFTALKSVQADVIGDNGRMAIVAVKAP